MGHDVGPARSRVAPDFRRDATEFALVAEVQISSGLGEEKHFTYLSIQVPMKKNQCLQTRNRHPQVWLD